MFSEDGDIEILAKESGQRLILSDAQLVASDIMDGLQAKYLGVDHGQHI